MGTCGRVLQTIISIHQPNFMPWYPFFDKVQRADIFVILTHVQFEKNGYQNRFNMDNRWHTLSVYKGLEPINKKKYVNAKRDWNKIKINLKQYESILSKFDDCICDSVANTNVDIIHRITEMLGITTKIVIDFPTDKTATNRLVEICKEYRADTYIAGASGAKYMDIEKFEKENINVAYQNLEAKIQIPILEILKQRGF